MGIYTNEEDIEDLLQITLSSTSVPDSAAVARWIEAFESRVVERRLGSHVATNEYIDVPGFSANLTRYNWVYRARTGRLQINLGAGRVIPLANVKVPIISVSALAKNDESPMDAPSWDTLTEGPADGSSWMLLTGGDKALGYALWFYNDFPIEGPKRLRLTYTYGHNVDSSILGEYCAYGTAIKVLLARMASNQPDGLSMLEGGALGTFVPRQYQERIAEYRFEMMRIETQHFPIDSTFGAEVV